MHILVYLYAVPAFMLLGVLLPLVMLVALAALVALPAIAIAHFGWGHYPPLRQKKSRGDKIAPTKPAGIPFMLTRAMKLALAQRGYSAEAIHAMTPAEAHRTLAIPYSLGGIPHGYVQPTPPRDNWLRQGDSYGSK